MQQYFSQLEACSLFQGIRAADMPQLLGCLAGRRASYPKDAFILCAGQQPRELAILLQGTAMVIREDVWGKRSLVQQLAPNDIFAESYVFADAQPLMVSVIAVKACQVLFLDGSRILSTCERACGFHNRLLMNLTRSIAGKNLALNRKMALVTMRSTREKLLSYLSQAAQATGSASFAIPLNRQELADYLCVDRSAMSAALSRLRREGTIDFHRNQFQILGSSAADTKPRPSHHKEPS